MGDHVLVKRPPRLNKSNNELAIKLLLKWDGPSVSVQRAHQGSGMFSSIMAASVFLQIVLICLVFKRLSSLPYMEVVNSNFRRIFCST